MRVAIVGSREFQHQDDAQRAVEEFVAKLPDDTVVISGGARGVDRWAESAARRRGLDVVVHRADWEGLGKRAGFVRNGSIVSDAEEVVAFWNGSSKGTRHTMGIAMKQGKKLDTRLLE